MAIISLSKGQVKTRISGADMQRAKIELENNPLLGPWKGPFAGVPPFDKVKVGYFKPALEKAMAEYLTEIDKIANNKSTPTFENTIAAMERSGHTLARVRAVFDVWISGLSSEELTKVEEEMQPRIAEIKDKIVQNPALFKRVEAVYNASETKKLTSEQQRLVWRRYMNFVLDGARLNDFSKEKVSAINQQLAAHYTRFSQNQLADESEKFVKLLGESDLAGLPQNVVEAALAEAKSRNIANGWVIANTRSSVDPFLTYSNRRDLREKVWKMFINRGNNGDKNDNNSIIPQILKLRAERSKLFGYLTHAHWRLANTMAKTPEAAMNLMLSVWKPSLDLVRKEVSDMQALADEEKAGIKIEPWDYRYYAEKVRKSRYDLDQTEVKAYLQLDKLQEGMFWVAGELFGMAFTKLSDVPVFHPDMQVWKVTSKESGKLIGLWYFDPYARKGKRSGAWMTAYRDQSRMDGKEVPTLVSNNSNFLKGKPGEPVLISWDDAQTLFHEFGHALHGLCSNVTYPTLSGTNVPQDYVEFPSQVLERWLSTPEVLQKFALHYKTGEPMPQALVDKIKNAATFNEGFSTVEATASALVDMKLHLMGGVEIDPVAFEKKTLNDLNMSAEIVMRHRLPQFGHIFSSDEYSAGYYSYLWSDVLSADAWEAFTEAGGPYDKAIAKKLYDHVFSVGNTIDQEEGWKQFRGRLQKPDALMRTKGLK